ncbi:hypothetical protein [Winogradskyella forsetii]|uniref:hypothetical protein n=1 Tax=Winogradskyella forsetii TaxID=2686077 RepID=UPI0015BAEB5C|nr:hypothetical protein [Winogradskyella forsetii]
MSIQVGSIEMRELADFVSYLIHEEKGRKKNSVGFALLTFDVNTDKGMTNYVCNCERKDMIKALKEFIHRNETEAEFPIPNEN